MAWPRERPEAEEMLDVRAAARLAGRSPETIRRWIWSGRLVARRKGNRLLVARAEVAALALERGGKPVLTLRAWATDAQLALAQSAGRRRRRSAADLVLEDRRRRSEGERARGGR